MGDSESGLFRAQADGHRVLIKGAAPVDIVGYRFYREHTETRGRIYLHAKRLAAKVAKNLRERGSILLAHAQAISSLAGCLSMLIARLS